MNPGRILIIKPSAMGDVIHALPLLTRLRAGFPGAHIAWLVNRSYAPLLEGHPDLDQVIVFEREAWRGFKRPGWTSLDFVRMVRRMRRPVFDVTLDLQGLLRSGVLTGLSGSAVRMGFAQARELAALSYTHRVNVPGPVTHAVDRYLLFARALGLTGDGVEFKLPTGEAERTWARELMSGLRAGGRKVVVMNPAARWPSKCWPAAYYAELADELARRGGVSVVYVGGGADRGMIGRIREMSAESSISLAGETGLRQLQALLREADLMVCNDSGPMHLAAAVGCPVLAFFGPTSPERTGPYPTATRSVVLKAHADCSPCFHKECHHRRCLEDIRPDQAFIEATRMLETSA